MTKKTIPFTYEDREQFRDRWIRLNSEGKLKTLRVIGEVPVFEHRIVTISKAGIVITNGFQLMPIPYVIALIDFEFTDGTPFGKEEPVLLKL